MSLFRFSALGAFIGGVMLASPASAVDKVTLAYPSPIGVQHSDLMFGKALGFFEEEGIELDAIALQGTPVVVPQIANKSVTFGIADPSYLISAQAKNEPMPVKFVYNQIRAVSNNFAVMANSPIQTIADLKGKKLGTISANAATLTLTKSVLKGAGVEWADVEAIPVGLGPAAWKQLETGSVDAVNFFRAEDAKMRMAGMDIRQLLYPEKFARIFVASIIANEETIRDNPGLVERFGRAVAKSAVACYANRENCVKGYWSYDPSSRPAPEKEAEWIAAALPILGAQYETVGFFHDGKEVWGSFPDKALDVYIEAMKESAIIPADAAIDEAGIYTNQFSDAFNNFDKAQYIERGKAYTGAPSAAQ